MNSRCYPIFRRNFAVGGVCLLLTAGLSCNSDDKKAALTPISTVARTSAPSTRGRPCPAEAPAPPVLPYSRPEHNLADFWLTTMTKPQKVLMDADDIRQLNQSLAGMDGETPATGVRDLLEYAPPPAKVKARLGRRFEHLSKGVAAGKRVLADGSRPTALLKRLAEQTRRAEVGGGLHLVHRSEPLRCYPEHLGIFEKSWDLAFDLNQCSQLRTGEPVKVLARLGDSWFVRSTYGQGWVRRGALTRPVEPKELESYLDPRLRVVVVADRVPLWDAAKGGTIEGSATLGAQFPRIILKKEAQTPRPRRRKRNEPEPRWRVSVPTAAGLATRWLDRRGTTLGHTPFTVEAVLRRAFSLLHTPYGWGGVGGQRDCSRLMMDLFASFGLRIPRNTTQQSNAGSRRVEVGHLDETAKAASIRREAAEGVVLMYMPGHIMLFVGTDGDRLFGLHLFSGYLQPCPGGGETMMRVNRAAVTSLDLGRGSSRRSFLQRITRLIVFGPKKTAAGDTDLR